jgi:oxaloacetate decarboxylase
MPLATFAERRQQLRDLLEAKAITFPGSVFDATSARLARAAGYQMGLFGGSVASAVVLGAPDLVLLTLSEFAQQVERLTRACDLPLMADADHGYGNALNVRRTLQELENAGVCALSIEDTVLPRRFDGPEGEQISREEFAGKLRAAADARSDKSLVIVGRTGALARGGLDEAVARVRICQQAGVDAVFATGVKSVDQIDAIASACALPLFVNALPASESDLVQRRVRVVMQGHVPYFAALKALYDSFQFLRAGGSPDALREDALTPELHALALNEEEYKNWTVRYLS